MYKSNSDIAIASAILIYDYLCVYMYIRVLNFL